MYFFKDLFICMDVFHSWGDILSRLSSSLGLSELAVNWQHICGRYFPHFFLQFFLDPPHPQISPIFASYAQWQSKYPIVIVTTPTQPQLNSTVGCDMKMTLHHHHHPPGTQRPQYLSCYRPDFYQTFKVGFWDQQQQ